MLHQNEIIIMIIINNVSVIGLHRRVPGYRPGQGLNY